MREEDGGDLGGKATLPIGLQKDFLTFALLDCCFGKELSSCVRPLRVTEYRGLFSSIGNPLLEATNKLRYFSRPSWLQI